MSAEGHEATTSPPPDRRDVLLEQFNAAEEAASKAAADAKVADEAVTEADTKDRFSPHYGKPVGTPRDETRKWVAKDKAAPAQDDAAAQVDAQTKPEPWQSPPASWKPHLRESWGKLDPVFQQYVHEREREMRAGVEPLLPKAELADKISQAAEPYMNTIRGLGLDLPRAVAGLMNVDHQLRTLPYDQKLRVLQQTALSYGIDLTGQMQTAQQAYDPLVQQLQNKMLEFEGRFSSLSEQQRAAENAAAVDQIQMFRQTQSPEYFDDVKPLMAQLLESHMATNIADAYDKAIRLTPELFDHIQSGKQAAADAEKRKAADEAAKRAKAAAVSVKSATPGHQTNTNAQDRRSVIRESLEALSERL